jgi:2-dehydro-3-deoxygluconokinase
MLEKKPRVITLGEIMLRLKSPGYERLLQSNFLEATFAGAEANVAVTLANFGIDAAYVTVIPENAISNACISFLRGLNVDTSLILRKGERIGVFYVEAGSNQRPSHVIYDRSDSAFSKANLNDFNWIEIFNGANWFHITGITPALSQKTADLTLFAVKKAKEMGLTVSCDYNYRKKLWRYGKSANEIMMKIVNYVDVGIANEEDCQLALGITANGESWQGMVSSGNINLEKYEALCLKVFDQFPNLKMQAITLRQSLSANHNGWSACLHDKQNFYVGPRFEITDIVDRIGGGDAFSGGLIFGLVSGMSHSKSLDFAVACSCLKHSIPGDVNRTSVEEVMSLLAGNSSGRIQR